MTSFALFVILEFFVVSTDKLNLDGQLAILAGILVLVLSPIYYFWLQRSHEYVVTDRRCVFFGGLARKVQRSIFFEKITDVEVSQTIPERLLRISNVRIFTAGTGGTKPEMTFEGLRDGQSLAALINLRIRETAVPLRPSTS